MDYEKEYKAMVQRAKELHKDGNALTKQQMEIVCPELAENDDEKIRNDIMKAVENWLPYERVEEIRAYLNAQKWQQSDGKAMFHVSEKSYQIGYRDGKMEQNPAEWGEKDEECRKELIQYIEQRIGDGTTGQSLWKKWHSWLCSLPLNLKKRKEQKPKPFSCGHENGLLGKLKAEIERIQGYAKAYLCGSEGQAELSPTQYRMEGAEAFCLSILSFIDSLQQEQPVLPGIEDTGIPGKDFIPVEWVDACEKYGKWKIVKQEQPEVDLEKEIDKEWAKCEPIDEGMGLESANIVNEQFNYVARHFYKLGLNAKKKESK